MSKTDKERSVAAVKEQDTVGGLPMDTSFSALSYALAGVQRGLTGLAENAQTIASANTRDPQLAELNTALVASLQNQAQVEAAAAVIKTVDNVLGTLIDTTA